MASSGSFNTTAYGNRHLVFSWSEQSQSLTDNETTIAWTLKGAGSATVYYMSGPFKVVIDGQTVYSSSNRIQLLNGTTVASGTAKLKHDATGAKSFSASVQAAIYSYSNNVSGSGSWSLDTIARASQPSLITWPETTNDVGNFGDTISIHMNRKSESFTHTVRYEFGSSKGTIATGVTTGTTWTLPLTLMNLLPAATQGSGRIYVDTYNGSTLVGTKYTGFTAHVPSTVKPTISLQVLDATNYQATYGDLVVGLSKLKVKITATPAYSSGIDSYRTTADGKTYTAAEFTTSVLAAWPTVTVTAKITDKRGRSATATASFHVINYTKPVVSALNVLRCDSDGTANEQGEYIKATFSAAITSLNSKNTAAYKLRYKKTSATSFTEVTFSDLAGKYTVTNKSHIFAASGNDSFDVEIVATDAISLTTRATSASTAFTLMNWGEDGTSVAFAKVAEKPNTFQNALDHNQIGNRYAFSSAVLSGSESFVQMANITITAANADTPITFVLSRRQESAPMTVHVSFRNSGTTSSTVSAVKYEGANYDAYIAPTGAMSWGLFVLRKINDSIITVQDWFTSEIMRDKVHITFPGTPIAQVPTPYYKATPAALDSILDYIYPVGSVYISYSHNDPATMFGGTWVRIENAFLWGVDSVGIIGQTGGAKTHTLTVDELPSHTHGAVYSGNAAGTKTHAWLASGGTAMAYGTVATGGGAAHNNMPPYVQISIWRRTA